MKKLFGFIAAAFVLASAFTFTSCDEADDLLGPVNTWCEMPITKTGSDGTTEETIGYVAMIYCDSKVTGVAGSSNLSSSITLEPGLTVVAWVKNNVNSDSLTGTVLNGLNSSSYVLKTFGKSEEAVSDSTDDTESFSFAGSRATWTAIYYSKSDLRNSVTQNVHPACPSVLSNGGSYKNITESIVNFSWKNLLKQYLINSL